MLSVNPLTDTIESVDIMVEIVVFSAAWLVATIALIVAARANSNDRYVNERLKIRTDAKARELEARLQSRKQTAQLDEKTLSEMVAKEVRKQLLALMK